MSLQKDIQGKIKEAMLAKDAVRLSVMRSLTAAFVNESVAKGRKPTEELPDEDALAVIRRAVKQRKESIEQFLKGSRKDLADKEEAELVILNAYLPQMMGREEIEKIARAKKEELGITEKSQQGKLMAAVMQELKGKADGTEVKAIVEALLS